LSGASQDAVVLLTGGTGFIGSHCLTRLLREDCTIHAVNRQGGGPVSERVTWHAADLRSPGEAAELVRRVRPTHLLHSAWIATPGLFWQSPDNERWLEGGRALVRAFGETGGRHLVGLGTCAEYDWEQDQFIEDQTPIKPSTPYGRSKAAMAAAAFADAASYGFTAAWGRVFQPYGVGEASRRLIPSVIDALIAKRPIDLTDGRQERDFIFAPDLADLAVRLLIGGHEGGFNIGTGRATALRTAVEYIAGRIGGGNLLRFGAIQAPSTEPMRLVADMKKVEKLVDWTAPTTLKAGLDEVVERALGVAAGRFSQSDAIKRGTC
jgi:nucleoside-diphosphate-sugar epimerase